MSKYIQNVHTALINCKVLKTEAEGVVGTRKEYINYPFQPEYVDHHQNRQIHTGFKAISDEEYKRLNVVGSLFQHMVKAGYLIVHDEAPAGAQTPYDVLQVANGRIAELEVQIESLKGGKNVVPKAELDAALVERDEANKALEILKAQAEGSGADLGDASDALAAKDAKIAELEALIGDDVGPLVAAKDARIKQLFELLVNVKKVVDEKNFKPASVLLKDLGADTPQF